MSINKNQKDIILAIAGIANNHTALASQQLEKGAVDTSIQAMQLEMAMKDSLMAQEALMRAIQLNAVTEKPAPVIPATAKVVTAPPSFPLKDTSVSPSAASKTILSAEPATEAIVKSAQLTQVPATPVSHHLTLRVDKPCMSCPFASTCEVRDKSTIIDNCGVSDMKAKASAAGEIAIEVVVDETAMTISYIAYKDGEYISHLALNKETKPLIAILEDYMGQRVFLNTTQKATNKDLSTSIFTLLKAEIVRSEPLAVSREKKEKVTYFTQEDIAVNELFSL